MGNKPEIENQSALTNRYARYRQMLCCAQPELDEVLRQGGLERTSFAKLSLRFDVILLDAFGVLNLGNQPIPGSVEAVTELIRRQHPLLVVSNNASQSPSSLNRRLNEMGFLFDLTQILSSGMAVHPFIEASDYRDRPYFLVGSEESASFYAPDPTNLMVNQRDATRPLNDAEYVLMCSNRDYYGTQQQALLNKLLHHQPLPLMLANPDLATPKPNGTLEAVAGFTAMDLADRFQTTLIGIGKPFQPIFQEVRNRFPSVPPDRFLMVGDTLDTDILGAKAMGFASCLAMSGAYAGWDATLEILCEERGIFPDYVIPCLGS
ncbi:MAG: HAD-IIA family hydrolase [Magnetococcus sp. YQC-5]